MKKLLLGAVALSLLAGSAEAKDRVTRNPEATNEEIILHAWSWNFPTIAENMQKIAESGYTIIQTSPVQACFSPDGGNKNQADF